MPEGAGTVYAPIVQPRVRKLYRCQAIILRGTRDVPLSQARYWASSDLAPDVPTLVGNIAVRWQVEAFLADAKGVLGLDQYQLMAATALVHFRMRVLAAYVFHDEERHRLQQAQPGHVTTGDARRVAQRTHRQHLPGWLQQHFQRGATAEALDELLVA